MNCERMLMAALVALRVCEETREDCERRVLEIEKIHVSNQNMSNGEGVDPDSDLPYLKITTGVFRQIIPIRENDYCGPMRLLIEEYILHAWEICDYHMYVHRDKSTAVILIDQNLTTMTLQCNSQVEACALFDRIVQTVMSARVDADADAEVDAEEQNNEND